jgi:hypothetical protein
MLSKRYEKNILYFNSAIYEQFMEPGNHHLPDTAC